MPFENEWLSRYPRPLYCIHDNGPEFMGTPFMLMLEINGINDIPMTVKNPQANAICEHLHQPIGITFMHLARAAIHRSWKISPGALVFIET